MCVLKTPYFMLCLDGMDACQAWAYYVDFNPRKNLFVTEGSIRFNFDLISPNAP